jgi:multidrug efflux pump subunit AcrA (membrane-fusion protein)
MPAGVAVRGMVEFAAGTARVYAPVAGELRAVHVRVGQTVEAGAPLATLSLAQGTRGLGVQMDELDRQVVEIERQVALTGAAWLPTARAWSSSASPFRK